MAGTSDMTIPDIIRLSDLLGRMGTINRATKLPSGEQESDSHHAFSLALIAYEINVSYHLGLNAERLLLFALAHDLLEIITGDEDTLHYNHQAMREKHMREEAALQEFDTLFNTYPALKLALYEYERLDTLEAASVFVLDKACTTWTHHHDNGASAIQRNIHGQADVDAWAERQRAKFAMRLKITPPQAVFDIFEESVDTLKGLYSV